MALSIHGKGFRIPKPYQIAKLLIWRQKCVAGILLIVHRVPPGTIIAVLFWTKYAVPRQIKPGILKITIRRGPSNLSISFIFVSCEEKGYYSFYFGRTAKFWLPLVLWALCEAADVMAIVFNWMLQVDLLVWRQTIDCKADTTWKMFQNTKHVMSQTCVSGSVSSKYGAWYGERVILNLCTLALWLALHIFATQRWRAPRRAKQLSTVAILIYRFFSCWCLEMFFT